MQTIPVHVFKGSFGPIIQLLNEHSVKYEMRLQRSGVPMASSEAIQVFGQVLGAAAMWAGLASVLVAFIKAKQGRKVVITLKDGTVVHAEGLPVSEVERLLEKAQNVAAIDPGKAPPPNVPQ